MDAGFKPFFEGKEKAGEDYLLCMEGIAFVEFLSYELLEKYGAFVGKKIFATGGAASSNLGLQIRADILQKSMHVPEHPHSAMGAAILAAAGYFNRGVGEVSKEMVSVKRVIEPILLTKHGKSWGVLSIFTLLLPFMSNCMKLLISDLDGTILETEDYHRLAYNKLFGELGLSQNWSKQDYMDRLQTMGGNKFRGFPG